MVISVKSSRVLEQASEKKQPLSSMSMELIKTSTTDLLFVAKLGFFSFFADSFKPFLTAYQTDSPMVPFLYTDIFRLLKNVYSVIVKPDVIAKCGTAAQLKEIDFNKNENMLSTKHINVGFVASKLIEKLIRQDQVKKDVIYLFKNKGENICCCNN